LSTCTLRRPRDAAEVLVERRLRSRLADLVVQVVAAAQVIQLCLRDRADVAEHLRGEIRVGVVTDVGATGRNAGKLGGVLEEIIDHQVARRLADDDKG